MITDKKHDFPFQRFRVFLKYDASDEEQFNVSAYSIIRNCSSPVEIIKFSENRLNQLGIPFNQASLFYIPLLENFRGYSLFLNKNIVVNCDITNLFESLEPGYPIYLCDNEFKYDVVVFNNRLQQTKRLNIKNLQQKGKSYALDLKWAGKVKYLDNKYNFTTKYSMQTNPDIINMSDENTRNEYKFLYDAHLEEMSDLIEKEIQTIKTQSRQKVQPKTLMERFWSWFGYNKYEDVEEISHIPVYINRFTEISSQITEIEPVRGKECTYCKKKEIK